ncbi:MAG: UDP-N-acetylmuramoyl-L-alanyl-D-glutamate--2,6-diaminopimelate ligase [Clostridia bacterium]|nr:UDP-N-acetylmuramoyl-L-alanyl-D-glutamate--2,6-diaminopimelate ligase [Clostridia bacterium]
MKVSELFGRAEMEYPPELGDIEITEIVTDSRQVKDGCLFLCIRGLHTDGHEYVEDAIKAGAKVIVAEQVRDACVGGAAARIVRKNTRKSAALLYNAWYGNPTEKLTIIGVTGTNGKTSVCSMLFELFRAAGYRCGIIGTVCCRSADGRSLSHSKNGGLANMTTPDPEELYAMLAEMAADGVQFVFMEVTSHALALHKVDAIRFDTAIFTNLTRDHLDFHGEMEEYYQAKKRLFSLCRQALIHLADETGKRLLRELDCPVLTYSVGEGDYCALIRKRKGMEGFRLLITSPEESFETDLPLVGEFSVQNALAASAVALAYGIPSKTVCRVLSGTQGAVGRMERLTLSPPAPFSVLIDYAHTPDALEKLLRSVRDCRVGEERIVLLFGCGGERDRGKRKEMAIIASRLADRVILTSDNSRGEDPDQIFADILKGMDKEKEYTVIRDRREAIAYGVENARKGDILILAGKGHETYEINGEGRRAFDEREIVREIWKRQCRGQIDPT